MLWQKGRRSDNVVSDSGGGARRFGGGGRGLGIGGIIIVVIVGLLFGKNPAEILQFLSAVSGGGGATSEPVDRPAASGPEVEFVRAVLGSTEDVWNRTFASAFLVQRRTEALDVTSL